MSKLPEPTASAVVVRGAITNRVTRVRRTAAGEALARSEADRRQREAADVNAPARASTARLPAAQRKELRAKGLPAGWHALCVLIPADQLDDLDGLLAAVKTAGVTNISRSKLIRIALRVVSTDAVIALARRAR